MINYIIYVVFAAIAVALFLALFNLLKPRDKNIDPAKTAKALTMRIGLSIFLFVFLIFCFLMGWIKPHGINPAAQSDKQSTILQPVNENKQK